MNISDFAKIAGVSKSAVSRYFNNGYLSEDKRIKIEKAIENVDSKIELKEDEIIPEENETVEKLMETVNEFEDSKKEFEEKIEKNPEKAQELIDAEIKKVEQTKFFCVFSSFMCKNTKKQTQTAHG